MKWQSFIPFLFAFFYVPGCSYSCEADAELKYSPELIEEFVRLETAFAMRKVAAFRCASYKFHEGLQSYHFNDICTLAFGYALKNGNWPFSYHIFKEFWRGPVVFNVFPYVGPYCLMALAHNEMNQVKISFNLIQNAIDKKRVVFQAIKERKFVLVGFDPMMNWSPLSLTDFIRILRSAIKYKQFTQVYECVGTTVENFAHASNSLLKIAVQERNKVAVEVLLAHHEVFSSRPEDLDIGLIVAGLGPETAYSEYLCYYHCQYYANERLLRPFWQNFYRLDWIDSKLAVILLRGLERSPVRHGQSPYSCLARVVRILSASDLPVSTLKKFSNYFKSFGLFNVAINSGNARLIDYVLQETDPTVFHFEAVGFAEDSLTKGVIYALNNPLYIRFLKASYAKGHIGHLVSVLRLIGANNICFKIQATKITKALIMNLPEIVWIVSKNMVPYYFVPRERCWLAEAISLTDYTEKLPQGCTMGDKWKELMMARVYSHPMMRLILATYGVYDADGFMNLIAICMYAGDFDAAYMALKSANGQFQLETSRPFFPGILNLDLHLANRIFTPRRFFPVIKLKEEAAPFRFSTDSTFHQMLVSNILAIIEAGHTPLLRYMLNNFDICPHEILSAQDLDQHHKVIGACYGYPDWSKLCFKSYGPVQVFLATCPLNKVNKLLPFFGLMNTLQIIKACLHLESDQDFSK